MPGVEEFEALCAFVEIVAKWDTVVPLLDLHNLLSLGNAHAGLAFRSLNRRFRLLSAGRER